MKPKYIRVASDLHLEQNYGQKTDFLVNQFVPADERDAESVLVLAGDISSKPAQLVPFLKEVEKRFPRVYFVPGNHEFYGHDLDKWSSDFKVEMGESTITKFTTLDVDIEEMEGVRFIYTTLWADGGKDHFERAQVNRGLRDFYVIGKNGKRFHVNDMMALHKVQRTKLEELIAKPFDGKTVVITHHMPSYRLCHPRFGSEINGGFAGNLDSVLAADNAPNLWIHGHTHDTIDTTMWKTRIVCNPSGYFMEKNVGPYNSYGTKFVEIETMNAS